MLSTSVNVSPWISTGSGSTAASGREAVDRELDRVHALPRPRGVRALAAEVDARVDVAEAAGWIVLSVGSIITTSAASSISGAASNSVRQRALLGGQLLAREEQEGDVDGRARAPRRRSSARARSSRRARAFMSVAPRPWTRRPRCGRACCPAPARCRGGRRAGRAACPGGAASRTTSDSPVVVHERGGRSCGLSASSCSRDSDGTSTSSSVARRARDGDARRQTRCVATAGEIGAWTVGDAADTADPA